MFFESNSKLNRLNRLSRTVYKQKLFTDEINLKMTEAKPAKPNKCCSSKCLRYVPEKEQENFRRNFKLCKTLSSRVVFIIANVSEQTVNSAKRKYNREYRCGAYPVCLNSFCHLLEISRQKVFSAFIKFKSGDLSDKRKHGSNNFLSEEKKQVIRNHINSMPRCLPDDDDDPTSSLEYLDPELNIGMMYRLFTVHWAKKFPDTNPPCQISYKNVLDTMGLKFKILETQPTTKKTTTKVKPRKKKPTNSKAPKRQQQLAEQSTTYQMDFENFQSTS
jgi:hypothetical protein